MEYINLSFGELKKIEVDNVVIVLPVGTLEVHGPNLPFGSDVFISEAFSFLISDKINTLIMPPIYYSYSGTTKDIYGSISIDISAVSAYIEDILYNLIRLNFKKILLINIHKDNDPLIKISISKVFDKTNIPVIYINPFENFLFKDNVIFTKENKSYKETSLILASIKILKRHININNPYNKKENLGKPLFIQKLRMFGFIRFNYKNEFEHIYPEDEANVDEGMAYMETFRDLVVEELANLDDYLKYLKRD